MTIPMSQNPLNAKGLEAAFEEANSPATVSRTTKQTVEASIRAYIASQEAAAPSEEPTNDTAGVRAPKYIAVHASDDPAERLAYELSVELEQADLDRNDFVTVNRAKLLAIATRVLASPAAAPSEEPVAWQWNLSDTWHTAEVDKFDDAEKYARSLAGKFGRVRAIFASPAVEPVAVSVPTQQQMNQAFYVDVCQAEDRLKEFIETSHKLLDTLPQHWHGDAETALRDLCDETHAVLEPHHHTPYEVEQATKRYGRSSIIPATQGGEAEAHRIEHDGFEGTVIGSYVTREGKRGVVLQQIGTKVVHVYGEKWLAALSAQDTDGVAKP